MISSYDSNYYLLKLVFFFFFPIKLATYDFEHEHLNEVATHI